MAKVFVESLESRRFLAAAGFAAKAGGLRYTHPYDEPLGWYFASARLSWNPSTNANVDGYRIYRSAENKGFFYLRDTVQSTTYLDDTLTPGTRFFYRVRPFSKTTGNFAALGTATVVTNLPPTTGDLSCTDDGEVSILVNNDSDAVTDFRLEWTEEGSSQVHTQITAAEWEGGADLFPYASFAVKNLSRLKQYIFRVYAINSIKWAPPFEQTLRPIASPEIKGVQRVDAHSIRVLWTNQTSKPDAFRLEWTTDDDVWENSKIADASDSSAIVRRLDAKLRCFFRVRAIVSGVESLPSDLTW